MYMELKISDILEVDDKLHELQSELEKRITDMKQVATTCACLCLCLFLYVCVFASVSVQVCLSVNLCLCACECLVRV